MDFPAGLIATQYCEAMRGFPGFPNSQCILYLETKITGVRSQIAERGVLMIFMVCVHKKEYSEEIMLGVFIF